ncbi:DUF58 domain-containing protein [Pseudogemmatithrix spongiicola]|uniref:DUF58 domain-containing protein n=1 Tax=Pseudogemmatithrix spongiicola TaxID=3062599 RepID=A0AA49K0I6_9BACT|nr:DUF58 domain-containing protein [Gemmatimonadaceae bacterium 'strain 138']WKW14988.1 DUF58 domain-containing protein [Gemmatimonadaceae bacterium 'strain 318']
MTRAAADHGRGAAVPPDVLRQVRRIELRTRGLVNSRFTGEYHSVFKGMGMEFAEVREYQPGDEVRTIDWNVSARMRKLFVKRFVEERELTVLLLVDTSGSSRGGAVDQDKQGMAAELAAVLALTATRNNDRVGLLLHSDRVEHVVPPKKGRRHALRLVRDVLAARAQQRGTDLGAACDYAARLLPHRSIVFVVSDFVAPDFERPLTRLSRRHDVVAVVLDDPGERELPNVGVARLIDPETGALAEVDTASPAVRARYAARLRAEREARQAMLRRLGVDEVVVPLEAGYVEAMLRFFRTRETRARRR